MRHDKRDAADIFFFFGSIERCLTMSVEDPLVLCVKCLGAESK